MRSLLPLCSVVSLSVACSREPPPSLVAAAAVPAGRHTLGSAPDEPCRGADAAVRTVSIGALEVDLTEATQASWSALAGLPAHENWGPECADCPVDSLTHTEARAYCAARSRAAGLPSCDTCTQTPDGLECQAVAGPCSGLRLPTGDEWEALARAGTHTSTSAGDVTVCMQHDPIVAGLGWTKTTSGGAPHPVGGLAPNPLGLFDMVGNLAEWTADPADADGLRHLRGGSWYHNAEHARAAASLQAPPNQQLSWVGVRCVRSIP